MRYFVGIDVSKKTFDVAITETGKDCFASQYFKNSEVGFEAFKLWLEKHCLSREIHVCFEAMGTYTIELEKYIRNQLKLALSIVNPFKIKSFANTLILRTKTDSEDSKLIARYCAILKPEATVSLAPEIIKLRHLIRFIYRLKKERSNLIASLENIRFSEVCKSVETLIQNYDTQIKKMTKSITSLVAKHPHLEKKVSLLTSIPGISQQTAFSLISELIQSSDGSYCRKANSAHSGLAPSIFQSGTSISHRPSISKKGSSFIRKILYMPTLSAIRFNPFIQQFYERLLAKGKKKMVAITACMRKLLLIAIGVLNNNSPFSPGYLKA